jgi:hypothetical protein
LSAGRILAVRVAVCELLTVAALAVPGGGANLAPTITSDELASPGAGCSLREAVLQANSNSVVDAACGPAGDGAATDTITLASGATYSLTIPGAEDSGAAGDLDISDNAPALDLVITGSGSTISNASSPKDRVLHVLTGTAVDISGVTISNGLAAGVAGLPFPGDSGLGGGILNLGTLTMADCGLIGNQAVGAAGVPGGPGGTGLGGGIATTGILVMTDCVVRLNLALGGAGGSPAQDVDSGRGGEGLGGGISQTEFFLVTLLRTRFESNQALGGAGGRGSTFGARAGLGGGGAYWGFSIDITESSFSGNLAKGGTGGGADSGTGADGGLGEGGALALQGGNQSVIGSTLSGNRAEGGDGGAGGAGSGPSGGAMGGGILKLTGLLALANSTLSGNAAAPGSGSPPGPGNISGGGLLVSMGGATLDSVTLTASVSQGIYSDGSVSITNSIVALQGSGPDCTGAIISSDFNIDSDATCSLDQAHDQPAIAAAQLGLGPLADNGGFTQTHAITPGLAAYNTGSTVLSTDQRGVLRPQWLVDDVGAFEQERRISVLEIPTVSPAGAVALAGLLALVAILISRRVSLD